VRHPRGLAGLHRQRRLGAIERLDLRLLIHAEHQRALRRRHVEPDDIDDLLGQPRIAGELERADLMRLELVLAPDPVHRRRRDPGRGRQSPHAPLHAAIRRLLQRLGQHPLDLVIVDRARTTRTRRVSQARHALLIETASPQPHGRQRHPELRGDLGIRRALGRAQHDPRPQRLLLRHRRTPKQRAQIALLVLRELDRYRGTRHTRHRTVSPFLMQATNGTLH
jgi:hypothetical protein